MEPESAGGEGGETAGKGFSEEGHRELSQRSMSDNVSYVNCDQFRLNLDIPPPSLVFRHSSSPCSSRSPSLHQTDLGIGS